MSTFRSPVGPQPSGVYWRRRLVVLGGIVVVIVIVILIAARPGAGKPTAGNTNTPSPSNTALTTAPTCSPSDVQIVAITDAPSYAAGVDPQISLSITNTGAAACSFKDGSDVQSYLITSGTDQIWSSKDCQVTTEDKPNTSILQPGTAISTSPIAWNRTRSNKAACSATNAPQVVAGGASYHLTATVNGITSTSANSPQFVLK